MSDFRFSYDELLRLHEGVHVEEQKFLLRVEAVHCPAHWVSYAVEIPDLVIVAVDLVDDLALEELAIGDTLLVYLLVRITVVDELQRFPFHDLI